MLSELHGWLDACDVANPRWSNAVRYRVIRGPKIFHLALFACVPVAGPLLLREQFKPHKHRV